MNHNTERKAIVESLVRMNAVFGGMKLGSKKPDTSGALPEAPKGGWPNGRWHEHQRLGHLERGRQYYIRNDDWTLYLLPGSIFREDAALACLDCDLPNAWTQLKPHLPETILAFENPAKPSHFHVWIWIPLPGPGSRPAWAKLNGWRKHFGEWRTAGKSNLGVGMALYPGEPEALVDALLRAAYHKPTLEQAKVDRLLPPTWGNRATKAASQLRGLQGGDRNPSLLGILRPLEPHLDTRTEFEPMLVNAYQEAFQPGEERNPAEEIGRALDTIAQTPGGTKRKQTRKVAASGSPIDAALGQARCKGWKLRFNIRSKRIEVRLAPNRPWEVMNDRIDAQLQQAWVESTGEEKYPAETQWRAAMNAWLFHHEVDPFRQYLDSLPAWDTLERLPTLLFELWPETRGDLARWAGLYLFLAPVQRTLEPGCKLDEIPIFVGDEDIGKSTAPSSTFPPELRIEMFGDRLDFAAQPQKQIEALQGKVIVECAELAGLTRSSMDRVKAFMTSVNDGDLRLSFRRNPDGNPRMCAFIGTANPDPNGIIAQTSGGLRRFVPIEVGSRSAGPIEPWMDARREQLWAEALVRYHRGERANLPRELKSAQQQAVQEHVQRNSNLEEAVLACLHQWPKDGLTLGEVAEKIGMLNAPSKAGEDVAVRDKATLTRAEQMALSAVLKDMELVKRQTSTGGLRAWRWFL